MSYAPMSWFYLSGGVLRQRRPRDDGGGVAEEEAPVRSKPLRRPLRKVGGFDFEHIFGGRFKIASCRYNLIETMPISMMKHLDEDVPPVFMILDTFDKDVKSLVSLFSHGAYPVGTP